MKSNRNAARRERRAFSAEFKAEAVRLVAERRPLGVSLAQPRARALAEASTELDRSKVEALYDPALLPPTRPLLSALLPGPSGEVWVRVFSLDAHVAPRCLVVSADGRVIAQATLPVDVQVEQIGTDFVLGIRRDSLGVESVVEYALQR